MKKIKLLFILAAMTLLFTGCNRKQEGNDPYAITARANKDGELPTEEEEEELENLFDSQEVITQSYGQFGFGIITDSTEMQLYEYDGKEVRIPYYVEGMDPEVESNFGVLLFVDGIAQAYQIQKKGEELDVLSYMKKFELGDRERIEFELVFKPVSGKKGEKVGFIAATILNPDYMASIEKPSFGINYALSANIPQQIILKEETEAKKKPNYDMELVDIPEETIKSVEETYSTDTYDILDNTVFLELHAMDDNNMVIAKNGKAKIKINFYGGKEVLNRITLYVNNEPIQIKDQDYLEIKTKKNKMSVIELELDTKSFKELNALYAVAMTAGSDYHLQDIYKSKTILLVNQSTDGEHQLQNDTKGITEPGAEKESNQMHNLDKLKIDYSTNCLVLHDLIKNESVHELKLKEKEFIYDGQIFNLEQGYGVIVNEADSSVVLKEVQGIKMITFPQNILKKKYHIYDENLNLLEEISLSEVIPEEVLGYEFIAISPDGKRIVWNMYSKLYYYETDTKRSGYLIEDQSDIFIEKIKFGTNNIVAFFGSGEASGETGTCLGFIDYNTKKLSIYVSENYRAAEIYATGDYVYLNDFIEPGNGYKSSGVVPILQIKDGKMIALKVEKDESTIARITSNGQYLLAIREEKNGQFLIRQYDIKTNKKIAEQNIVKKGETKVTDIRKIKDSELYAVVFNQEGNRTTIDTFKCEE